MKSLKKLFSDYTEIELSLGYSFQNKSLLALALIHRSFVNENRDKVDSHNERLEFLGDAILGLLISDYLYRYLPTKPEGELSYIRSRLVDASSCKFYVCKLKIEQYLLMGKGERMNDGRGRDSILSNLFEAIIGAIYLDGGLEAARKFLFQNFSEEIGKILTRPEKNWKAELQDYSQKKFQQTPIYNITKEEGPDHNKTFEIEVLINNKSYGTGKGSSKKSAQQDAAEIAFKTIEERDENGQ